MQCMILLPGQGGRLPSAEELSRAGFALSAALGRREPALAQAAEPPAEYGAGREEAPCGPEAEAAQG